ncbi:uncharacterized protein LOC127443760 [Myxocyprinus asiaticus]|uniref:uncharacterized protein LOC127443760 n=1 Tax=Myxocyprinus asiaticus TaxID=70543 RepID=UPI0022234F1C|nr:uncharacterized protein LOC127443760 [Myxocyprinus asiaticus]
MIVSLDIQQTCTNILPEVSAALVSNAPDLTVDSIMALNQWCTGLSTYQISQTEGAVLKNALSVLSAVIGWNQDQAIMIIQKLLLSGVYQIYDVKRLQDLGSLIIGVSSSVITSIPNNFVLGAVQSPSFLANVKTAPVIIQQTIVSQMDKQKFLKTFIRGLRKSGISEMKIINMMSMVKESSKSLRFKRATECTVGQIMQVQIYSDSFPFNYDVTQFNVCLSVQTLKFNLEAITDKVYDRDFQRIILNKLNQAYPDGIPDEVLQVLGSSSRAAMPDDVKKWSVTKIDTLSSLMNSRNGDWDHQMVQLIISKYLSVSGNFLGTNELNSIRGSNLCALNASVLNNITAASVEQAAALSLNAVQRRRGFCSVSLRMHSVQ